MWELRLKEIGNVSKVKRLSKCRSRGLSHASNLCWSTSWSAGYFLARSDHHCSTTSCLQNSILQLERNSCVLLWPSPLHVFTEHSWPVLGLTFNWSWTNLIGPESNQSDWSRDGHSVQIQPARDFVSGILHTGTRNQTQILTDTCSSRCKAETWRPGAAGGHSLGKWRQEGKWVMAESLVWEVPKPSCVFIFPTIFGCSTLLVHESIKSLSAQAGSSYTLVLNNQKGLGLK